jgi:hypothetical protein
MSCATHVARRPPLMQGFPQLATKKCRDKRYYRKCAVASTASNCRPQRFLQLADHSRIFPVARRSIFGWFRRVGRVNSIRADSKPARSGERKSERLHPPLFSRHNVFRGESPVPHDPEGVYGGRRGNMLLFGQKLILLLSVEGYRLQT